MLIGKSFISQHHLSCSLSWLNLRNNFNRVKSLSKSSNPKKDQPSSLPPSGKESSAAATSSITPETEDVYEQYQESKVVDTSRRVDKETSSFNFSTDDEKQPPSLASSFNFNGREESAVPAGGMERERLDVKNSYKGSTSQKTSYAQSSSDVEEKVQKVSPPRQKAYSRPTKDFNNFDVSPRSYRQQSATNSNVNTTGHRQNEPEQTPPDGSINEILEVCFKHFSIINVVFVALNLF